MFMPILVEAAKLALKRTASGDVHFVIDGKTISWQGTPPKQAAEVPAPAVAAASGSSNGAKTPARPSGQPRRVRRKKGGGRR